MKSIMKTWLWYDWMTVGLRTLWLLIVGMTVCINLSLAALLVWVTVISALVVYFIPLIVKYRDENKYLVVEVLSAGTFYLYIAYFSSELLWSFAILVIIIGLASNPKTYVWAGISCGFIFPIVNGWISNQPPLELVVSCSVSFAMGYAFNVLIQSHKQAGIIQEQKQLLEQHLTKIEELTLKEERSRLSHELHDTVGHSLTSLIVGVESLRSYVPVTQIERIDALVSIGQHSLDDIRKHMYQLTSTPLNDSLSESLLQLTQEFMKSTGIHVNFRVIGRETLVIQKMSFCLYRCLQESLTNAVRHGQASEVSVQLYFESQQIRLQIEDNGVGMESSEFGFGLHGMLERLELLDGTLSVHSQLEQGTIVICTIPLQAERIQGTIRLLIVDDQAIIADSLKHIMNQHADFLVVGTACNGQGALELCEQFEPDIVLMDVHMQGMNGLEALRVMKQRWPTMKVVLMTTFEDAMEATTALENGAEGYMLKSTHSKEIMEAMKLIYRGGTWIDQSVAVRVFEVMKRQREVLEKIVPNDPYGLTKRDREILEQLSNGMRYKSIAAKLFLTEGTVRNYCSTLYSKLGVSNREEAVELARTKSIL
ncbi:hybrid sensor histidine kinase/response regulator transcription factor [Paenibacillus sp. GSMTC-2017]|uniref:helix-turn-helix transcriptional regulator n=1 Tax=Paenibacillus sp. GSMTC-2017 TaxID=2794350 RepID=UPI0018D92535|nr:hybrid sensor histidine kinase/response regulator transcription factor [Paenibacillus sp. GSMTC-2017]MBH5319529.1 hybrid sensor histidine kinase/response regulator transcription factor [Paenibacillus sp. GSMTC-2017]